MNPKVSVIIPVYNVEPYLRRCLDSVITQTFTDFEVILIDDGSTDGSGAICDEYAAKDSRFKVHHKTNGGVSTARNMGLSHAIGEYIVFIDSDDYVDRAYIFTLYESIVDSNSDIAIIGCKKLDDNNNLLYIKSYPSQIITSENLSTLFSNFMFHRNSGPVCKILKKSIIEANNLTFKKNIHLGEDIIFILSYIEKCNKIKLSNYDGYYYIERSHSLTKSLNDFESEYLGLIKYNEVINSLSNKLDTNSVSILEKWRILFLERIKLSILTVDNKRTILFKKIDWKQLKLYKTYESKKDYFLDSLLWNKQYRLFCILHKIRKIWN